MNGVSHPQQQSIREMFYRHAALRTRLTAVRLHSPVATTGIHRRWQSRHKVLGGSGSGSTLPAATSGIYGRWQSRHKVPGYSSGSGSTQPVATADLRQKVANRQKVLGDSGTGSTSPVATADIDRRWQADRKFWEILVLVPHRQWQLASAKGAEADI